MTVSLNDRADLVEPAARVLRTAIDVGDGGTESQRRMFGLVTSMVWERPDLTFESLDPITPIEVAEVFDDAIACRRLRMMLVPFELLRTPLTSEQVALVDGFALALGGDDEGLRMARRLARNESDHAIEHLAAAWALQRDALSAATVRERYEAVNTAIDDPALAAELRRMAELPRGTLGREYLEFYLHYDFAIPGEGVSNPAFFVQHDMGHLVAGFGPSAPEEVALSAFQVGMKDNDAHWMQFVMSLAAYEVGIFGSDDFEAKEALLSREGAMELVLAGFNRGALCTENYNDVALLEFADRPIRELRERFGVQPPPVPFPEFIDVA